MIKKKQYQIFISYKRSKENLRSVIKPLTSRLREYGFSCWFDEDEMRTGRGIDQFLPIISEVDFFLPIITEDYKDSKYCRRECTQALSVEMGTGNLKVLPIAIVPPEEIAKIYPELSAYTSMRFDETSLEISTKQLVEELRKYKKKIHLLIEPGTEYTDRLRSSLKSELGNIKTPIEVIDVLQGLKDIAKLTYYFDEGIRSFQKDPYAEWLICVYPEIRQKFLLDGNEQWFLSDLQKGNKKAIFIESGHKIKVLSQTSDTQNDQWIKLIESDHAGGMAELTDRLMIAYLKRKSRIHLVLVSGPPESKPSQDRFQEQEKLISKLVLTAFHGSYDSLHLSVLPCFDWKKTTAKELLMDKPDYIPIGNPEIHTCFICGNDDLALGILEALEEISNGEVLKTGNKIYDYSIAGFDGNEEFKEKIRQGLPLVTMEVQYDTIASRVLEEIENNRFNIKNISLSKIRTNLVDKTTIMK